MLGLAVKELISLFDESSTVLHICNKIVYEQRTCIRKLQDNLQCTELVKGSISGSDMFKFVGDVSVA